MKFSQLTEGQRQIIDRDGNAVRKGMAVISAGETWVVAHVAHSKADWAVVLDRPNPDGTLASRRLIGRKRLYCVHIIGYQIPQVL